MYEPIFDSVGSRSIKQCRVFNTIGLGKIPSISPASLPDEIGNFGKQKVLDNPQIGCGCNVCMNGGSVCATNVPLTLPEVHDYLTWALQVSTDRTLADYCSSRSKWATFDVACTSEPMLYKVWKVRASWLTMWHQPEDSLQHPYMRMVY